MSTTIGWIAVKFCKGVVHVPSWRNTADFVDPHTDREKEPVFDLNRTKKCRCENTLSVVVIIQMSFHN